jgi:hypothetical protein
MQTEDAIINRVASSGLVTIELEQLYHPGPRVAFDLAPQLYQGLVLREKEFRDFLKQHDWEQYRGQNVAVFCSEDAIVPVWAYMLLAIYLEPVAHLVVFGGLEALEDALFRDALAQLQPADYQGAKVVIKGCSHRPVPPSAFVEVARRLRPVAASIMYGEPCSTVPLYKKPVAKVPVQP